MLSLLQEKLEGAFKKLRGHTNIGDTLRDVRLALLEADVDFQVTKDLIEKVREKAMGADVLRSVSPSQQIVKIFHDELVTLLGSEASSLNLEPPPRILIA